MKDALGLVEIKGLATAVLIADTMVKTAQVKLIDIERTRGLGWITIKISGDVAAVTAAVNAGKRVGEMHGYYISSKVIPRPSESVDETFCTVSQFKDTYEPPKAVKAVDKLTKKKVVKEKSAPKEKVKETNIPSTEKTVKTVDKPPQKDNVESIKEKTVPKKEIKISNNPVKEKSAKVDNSGAKGNGKTDNKPKSVRKKSTTTKRKNPQSKSSAEKNTKTIIALRHIHMTPKKALELGVKDNEVVEVQTCGKRRCVLGNVLARVSNKSFYEMHIDLDEANACALKNNDFVILRKIEWT